MLIRPIFNLFRALQSNTSPGELASGAVLALYFGLTPLNHTHVIFLLLMLFFFKINRALSILVVPVIKIFYYLGLANLADFIGTYLLVQTPALGPFWARVTHTPVLAYLDLQYTMVLGGLLLAAALSLPMYLLAYLAVNAYRAKFRDKVNSWRIVKWLQGLSIVQGMSKWGPPHE